MSDLLGEVVVDSTHRIRKQVEWVGENRNEKKFRYSNLPSNVLSLRSRFEEEDGTIVDGANRPMLVQDHLLGELINDLAVERPQWTFLVTQTIGVKEGAGGHFIDSAQTLLILDNLEPIGLVKWAENWKHGKHVTITNNRIKQDLMNKNSRLTGKLQRAKQIINKEVFGLSLREVLINSSTTINNDIRYAKSKLHTVAAEKYTPLGEWARQQFEGHSPQLLALSEKMGQGEIVKTFLDAEANHELADSVTGDIEVGAGKMVVLVGEEYHVAAMGGVQYVRPEFSNRYIKHTRDTLDPGMHTALALLKLTEPNTFVAGAGFKASDTEYFIVEEITIGKD